MDKFNKESRCKKCGCTAVSIKFVVTELIYNDEGRLERTCARCGYSWWEESLDN